MSETTKRWTDAAVLVALLAVVFVEVYDRYEPHSFLHGDGAFYANINISIVEDFSLVQDDLHPRSWLEKDLGWNRDLDQGWSNVSLGADNETWYPKHPYLMSALSTPFYVVWGMPGLLIFNALMMVLLLFFSYRVALRFSHPAAAAFVVLMSSASPLILSSAYSYSNDVFYAALLMMGFDGMLSRRWVVAGLLMGMAVWAKVTNLFFVVPLALWFVFNEGWRPLVLRFGAAFSVPVGLFALGNWIMFGAPWITSYDCILIRTDGLLALESARERMGTPFGEGLKAILGTDGSGLLKQAPLVVVGFAGIVPLFRRRWGLALVLVATFAAYCVFFAHYEYVYARFFLPWFGLAMLVGSVGLDALASALARALPSLTGRRWLCRGLGVALALVAVALWVGQALRAGESRRLSDHVREAEVTLGKIPCDYFNNQHNGWECTRSGEREWAYVVQPLDERCRAEGFPDTALWLHPSPRRIAKSVVFDGLPWAGRLRVVAMRAPGQKGKGLSTLELRSGETTLLTLSPSHPRQVEEHVLDLSRESSGAPLELRVSGSASSKGGLGICVEVFWEEPVSD